MPGRKPPRPDRLLSGYRGWPGRITDNPGGESLITTYKSDKRTGVTRRRLLQTTTAAVAVSSFGFPYIAQAKPEKLIIPDAGGALRDAYLPSHYKGGDVPGSVEKLK